MTYKLRGYQERAVQEAIDNPFMYEAFDMGLGKTLIMLDYLRRTGNRAVVVAPLLVAQRTWPQEIQKFTPELTYTVLHGRDKDDLYRQKPDIKIINYDGLKWFYNMIAKHGSVDLRGRVLILDESTQIKSPASVRFRALKPMRHFFAQTGAFCLSGEPMPNGYHDLWSQYFMLDHGKALGKNISEYRSRYFDSSGPPFWTMTLKPGADQEINRLVAPMTSVLKAEDHLEMPESYFIEVPVDLPRDVRTLYNSLKKDFIIKHGANLEHAITADSQGVLSGKLRQLVQGCMYSDGGEEEVGKRRYEVFHMEKIKAFLELYEQANGSPILCPIYFSFEYEELCKALKYRLPLIAGGTSLAEKEAILNQWDQGKVPVLVVHPQSVSHGLNMQTGGNKVIWMGRPWSLEHYKQLNGRLIRPGQTRAVTVHFISVQNSIDSRVASTLANKDATQSDFINAIMGEFLS